MAMNFGKLDFAVAFNRQTAFPLDAKSYFESLELANAAAATAEEAGSSNTTYYYGQQIAVVESGVATLYVIQPDKTLKEVGGKIAINENVFVKDTEGKLDLLGFADAVAGAQLVKSVDGKVSWVKPDTTTVEGLQTAVAGLRTDVDNLSTAVGKAAQGETAATGLFKEVSDIKGSLTQQAATIEGKADKATTLAGYGIEDAFTKTETTAEITKAISQSGHAQFVKAEAVPTVEEAEANKLYLVYNEATQHYDIYAKVDNAVELLDDTTVDLTNYYRKDEVNTELAKKVDKVDGKGLSTEDFTTELKNKLVGIAQGAEVNVVKSVKDTDFVLSAEGQLQLKDTVATAVNAVANKVDKEEGKSLVSDTEIAKLLTVQENAEPNYVKSVDAQFEVNTEGQLSLKELAQDKIAGLPAALEGKVDKEPGKGLSTHDFTDEFVNKLNAINLENIQANVIEKITLNGVETQVVEKTIDIPLATTTQFGLVKGSNAENEVAVKADGIMSVNALNIQKLSQTEGEILVLDCGKA